jgi:hypothetical protein
VLCTKRYCECPSFPHRISVHPAITVQKCGCLLQATCPLPAPLLALMMSRPSSIFLLIFSTQSHVSLASFVARTTQTYFSGFLHVSTTAGPTVYFQLYPLAHCNKRILSGPPCMLKTKLPERYYLYTNLSTRHSMSEAKFKYQQ